MSIGAVVAIGLLLTLVNLVVNAFFLWLSARLFRTERIGFRRALAVSLVVMVLGIAVCAALLLLAILPPTMKSTSLEAAIMIIAMVMYVVGVWLVVRRSLRSTWLRTAGALLTTFAASYLVSHLLALGTKMTLAEAFVIPTGSMAPTLQGRHAELVCPNCQFAYAASLSDWFQGDGKFDPHAMKANCPNCGQSEVVRVGTPVVKGDRVLVDKLSRPARWDLAVFDYPEDPAVKFVARVVGLPGERVQLVGGDVFISGSRLQKAPDEARDLWFLVHDTAYGPRKPIADGPRWQPAQEASKWHCSDGRWVFSGTNSPTDGLRFTGKITDELAYNSTQPVWLDEPNQPPLVGDVMLDCRLEAFSGAGNVRFGWQFAGRQVEATISAQGNVELKVSDQAGERSDKEPKTDRSQGRLSQALSSLPRLAFAVRDGQAYVLENDRPIARVSLGSQDVAAAQAQSKQIPAPCRVTIAADHCMLTIARLRLFRDVYYRSMDQMPMASALPRDFAGEVGLGKGQYWLLGDNSDHSKDCRFFGPVRAEAIIGVARWIYWPLARCHEFD
jgi:signal peptidase I